MIILKDGESLNVVYIKVWQMKKNEKSLINIL